MDTIIENSLEIVSPTGETVHIYINKNPDYQKLDTWVGVDIEIFRMDGNRLHRAVPGNGTFALAQISIDNTVYVCTETTRLKNFLESVSNCVWVFQNAKFDLSHLERWVHVQDHQNVIDTMLLERILYSGLYKSFRLNDLVRRHLGIYLDKDVRSEFATATELTEEMICYGALDAFYTLKIAKIQWSLMDAGDKRAWQIDKKALFAVLDFQPIRVDVGGWESLVGGHKENTDKLEALFDFNPRSSQQINKRMAEMKIKIDSTGKYDLLKALEKQTKPENINILTNLINFKEHETYVSKYGMNWIEQFAEEESPGVWVFASDYSVSDAETGRMTASKPSAQNVPAIYDYRSLFIPRPGNVMLVGDWQSQEPRITAYLTKDQNFYNAITKGVDVYCSLASLFFGQDVTDKHDPLRKQMKGILLGVTYGMTPRGLARDLKCTVAEAEKILNEFFKMFPDVKKWVDNQHNLRDFTRTVIGRKSWLPIYSYQKKTNELNNPHQGTAADMMKLALGIAHTNWNPDWGKFGVVNVSHDEIVMDVPERCASEILEFQRKVMMKAGSIICENYIEFPVDVKIVSNWWEGKS